MAITAEVRSELIQLVVGMFNAAPGFKIMTELVTASNAGSSVAEIAASLESSTEFKNLYPIFLTNEEYAKKLVNSLVGSLASDEQKDRAVEELTANLNAGASRSEVVLTAVNFLSNVPADEEENFGAAGNAFVNKVDVATYFTIDQQKSGASLADLQAVIANVTDSEASVDAAKGAVDGQTFTLTTGVDSFTGGAGNDTFNTIASGLSAGDELIGGTGRDTLIITDKVGGLNIALPTMTITGIEDATVTTTGSIGRIAVSGSPAAAAIKQVSKIETGAVVNSVDTYTVTMNGGSITTAASDGSATKEEAATKIAAAVNILAGATIAAVVGDDVIVTAPSAGVAIPTIAVVSKTNTVADTTNRAVVSNIVANAEAVAAVATVTTAALNLSAITENLTVTAAGPINLTAAATANVDATTTSGLVTLAGGLTQDVVSKGGFVVSGGKGAITVIDSAQGAVASTVNGGTTAVITSTSSAAGATTGTINVGASSAPTGAVTLTSKIVEAKGDTNTAGGAITVKAGGDVNVTQTATKALQTTALANGTITNAPVTVTGGAATKSVTVDSAAAVTATNTVLAVAAVTEVNTVTFGALTNGQVVVLGGLTFTAGAAGTTAAQTAAAFANLTSGATQGNSTLGTYTGTFTAGTFTSGAVGGTTAAPTVVFTGTSAGARTDLSATGSAAGSATVATTTDGVNAVKASGSVGVTANTVTVTDVNNGSTSKAGVITDVTAHNYTTATVNSNALTTLNLKNGSSNITIGNGSLVGNTNKTLNLSLDGVTGGTLGDANVYTAINVTTKYTGTATATGSTLADINSSGVTALAVAGDKVLTLTSAAGLTGLKTVTVTGSAGLSASVAQGSVTAVNTTGTTGTATITLDATKATYTGGAGVDKVTTSAGVSKAINLGAGDDSLTLASGTTAVTGAISGGDGTDTLSMVTADAVTASANTLFSSLVTDFEQLTLTGSTGGQTVNLANIGITNFVTVGAQAGAGVVTLQNLANNGTVVIAGTHAGVTVTNAAFNTPTTDVLNFVTALSTASVTHGTITAAKVETVNLTATDISTAGGIQTSTVTLTAADATLLTITGNANLDLTLTGSVKLATLDASAATGAVTATSLSTTAMTLIGGSGNDSLTAKTGTNADVLIGGAGNDTLTNNAGLTTLTGGSGLDLFVIATAGANGSMYSTITDASAGDRIQFSDMGTETFTTTKLVLAGTASFTDYLNAAAAGTGGGSNGVIRYFDFGGNTYVTYDKSNAATFVNGTDVVVELTGIVNLSTASLSYVGGLPTLMIGG